MTPLIQRASTGERPLLPIAIVTGERSTIAGMMKVQSCWSSTTLQKRLASSAAAATAMLTARSSVAATTSQ
jgi:hypothetical protein